MFRPTQIKNFLSQKNNHISKSSESLRIRIYEMDYGNRTFPENWFVVDPDLPDKEQWLPWYNHVENPLVWISLRVDESGLKAFDSWLPERAHESHYNEAARLLRQHNLEPYNRPDISQTVCRTQVNLKIKLLINLH